jgi:hypothetical protein
MAKVSAMVLLIVTGRLVEFATSQVVSPATLDYPIATTTLGEFNSIVGTATTGRNPSLGTGMEGSSIG